MVKKSSTLGLAPLLASALLALVLAGCGSSSKSSSGTTSAAAAASTPTTSTSSGGGAYGAGAAASTSANAASSTSSAGETITAKHSKLGTILAAGPKKLTVYLFEADKNGQSACSAECAKFWPPVTTGGSPQASGAAMSADLGTITRSDGTKQVTYKGHPLYFFAKDKDDGDAYGQGTKAFGADWYVLKPSGSKVDAS
jgi:predicted lipoprotein with Yx(FWY)xxD motif